MRIARGQCGKEEAGVERALHQKEDFPLLHVKPARGMAICGMKNAHLLRSLARSTQDSPTNVCGSYGSSNVGQPKHRAPATAERKNRVKEQRQYMHQSVQPIAITHLKSPLSEAWDNGGVRQRTEESSSIPDSHKRFPYQR